MWPFRSREEKEAIRERRLKKIVAVGPSDTNAYRRNCAYCGNNFPYSYAEGVCSYTCPSCGYVNWHLGMLMAITDDDSCPSLADARTWLRRKMRNKNTRVERNE